MNKTNLISKGKLRPAGPIGLLMLLWVQFALLIAPLNALAVEVCDPNLGIPDSLKIPLFEDFRLDRVADPLMDAQSRMAGPQRGK